MVGGVREGRFKGEGVKAEATGGRCSSWGEEVQQLLGGEGAAPGGGAAAQQTWTVSRCQAKCSLLGTGGASMCRLPQHQWNRSKDPLDRQNRAPTAQPNPTPNRITSGQLYSMN